MKTYAKKLKFETVLLAVASLLLLVVQALAFSRIIRPLTGPHWIDFWNGMLAGASFSIMALFLAGIVVNLRALTNEARLKKLYAREHDERTAHIARTAQSLGMRVGIPLVLVAALVAGYFDVKISLTCLACAAGQSVITSLAKLYYHHTM